VKVCESPTHHDQDLIKIALLALNSNPTSRSAEHSAAFTLCILSLLPTCGKKQGEKLGVATTTVAQNAHGWQRLSAHTKIGWTYRSMGISM